MDISILVSGKRHEHLQVGRKNSILCPGFGPLLFISCLCLPLLGKVYNLLRCLANRKELLSYSWQHLSHSNPVN